MAKKDEVIISIIAISMCVFYAALAIVGIVQNIF